MKWRGRYRISIPALLWLLLWLLLGMSIAGLIFMQRNLQIIGRLLGMEA